VQRFALVKAHGREALPAILTCGMRNLDLPALLVSLDNSCPLRSRMKKSGKNGCFVRAMAKVSYTSQSSLAALRPLRPPHVRAVRAVLARSLCKRTYTARIRK